TPRPAIDPVPGRRASLIHSPCLRIPSRRFLSVIMTFHFLSLRRCMRSSGKPLLLAAALALAACGPAGQGTAPAASSSSSSSSPAPSTAPPGLPVEFRDEARLAVVGFVHVNG